MMVQPRSGRETISLTLETPRAFLPLLKPARYKGAYGGRGGAKSHFFAEMLIEDCIRQHTRAACLREVQRSIKDSVKQLLEDKIRQHRLDALFRITDQEISGPNDSLIIFRGLQSFSTGGGTASTIKSLEGFNRAFFEEAQTISQRSLDLATPTFRAPGAEMWFAWNPRHETDPVDRLFRENTDDPDFVSVKVTYADNPWFPDDLRRDMERDKVRDPDKYAHVWLGEYERKSEARVFRNWKIEDFETPERVDRFYFGADWGFSVDPTVLVRCFIVGRKLFVDHEAYMVGCDIDRTPSLFDSVPGARAWPIVADSARPETISYMRRAGFNVSPARKGKGSVEEGVEFLKSFDIVVHPRCKHVIDELTFYSYEQDRLTGEILPVLRDEKNHCIDALRYAVESTRRSNGVVLTGPIIITGPRPSP